MVIRILSAIALLPMLLVVIHGGVPLYILESILIIMALRELYGVFRYKKIKAINIIGYIFGIYLGVKNLFNINYSNFIILFILFIISVILILIEKYSVLDVLVTFSGIFYISIFIDYIPLIINNFEYGNIYVWLIFILAFCTDIFAYFIGFTIGKNKLIPTISPKKTIEGSIGGIIGSVIGCVIYGYIFKLNIIHMIIIGLLGSFLAQIGDLFASAIKRYVGVKDYGNLIPGHGGILDRIDSILFVTPFIYIYISLILK